MVWIPLNDNDPVKQVSDEWFDNLPQYIRNSAISLARSNNLTPVNLRARLSISHGITLATATLSDFADMLGIGTKR